MSAGLRFSGLRLSCRGVLICVALVSGCVAAARANVLDDIGDFFSGNAPEVASSQDCESYARDAMYKAQYAQQYKCPLGGDRYGTNEKGHYGWCMGVTHETSNVEAGARNAEVAACMSLSNQIYCNTYGEQAAKDAHANKLYHCGFTGPRWGEGAAGHRAYCLSEKIAQAKEDDIIALSSNWPAPENSARIEALRQCKSTYSEKQIQFCNSYATQAVASAKTFKERYCDRSQNSWGRWESGYDHHFSWCIFGFKGVGAGRAKIDSANSETETRTAAVNACIARGGGPPRPTPVANRPPSAITKSLEDFSKAAPSDPLTKPAAKKNSGPGTGGAYLSKPIDGNSAMDRLGGGGGASGGGGGGINTSRPGAPSPRGGSSGLSPSKPAAPSYGGGINTSKPSAPTYGGGVNLSR